MAATWFDAGLVGFHLVVLLVVAVYFFGERRRANAVALAAPRSVGWIPVALSFPALALPWMTLGDLSGGGYEWGYRLWIAPLALVVSLPLVALCLAPLYQRLGGVGVSEYLEWRFGATSRRVAALTYGLGRALLAAAGLAWSCRLATDGAGIAVPTWLVVLVIGGVATTCAALAGRRGLPWIDVWQSVVLVAGIAVVVGLLWNEPGINMNSVADTARQLGRSPALDLNDRAPDGWSLFVAFPGYVTLGLALLGVDRVAQQRWSMAGPTGDAQRSLILGGVLLAATTATSVYLGIVLLDFYHRRPDALRGRWVANIDSPTRKSLTDPTTRRRRLVDPRTGQPIQSLLSDTPDLDPTDGRPLLDWYADEVNLETVAALVSERRLLRPNSKEPFTEVAEVVDPLTGRLDLGRIMMRRPTTGHEIILHRRAAAELLPWFAAHRAPWGCAAIVWCAMLAGAISSVASTALVVRELFAHATVGATAARPANATLTLAVGGAIVLAALAMLPSDMAAVLLVPLAALAFGPVAVGLVLGLTSRRGNGSTATLGMVVCLVATTLVLIMSLPLEAAGMRLQPLAALPTGLASGLVVGWCAALATGRPRSRVELRGLTIGCGPLGVRQEHSALGGAHEFLASTPTLSPPPPQSPRWKE